jgi:DNA-binding NarL/FixJ family response regulator
VRVLFVTGADAGPSPLALSWLLEADAAVEATTFHGAAAAMGELRTSLDYQAVLIDVSVPHNETLALIATVRRDRLPISVVVIVGDADAHFFATAMTAGADDVLLMNSHGLLDAAGTLERIRAGRHFRRDAHKKPLAVLYIGNDDLAWDLLSDMAFVQAARVPAAADGSADLGFPGGTGAEGMPDVIVIDEHAGDSHALQVVKWLRSKAVTSPIIMLTSPTGADVGGAALDLGADDIVAKSGTYRRRLLSTLHRIHRQVRQGAEQSASAARLDEAAIAAADEQRKQADEQQRELEALRAALAAADKRIGDLAAEARGVTDRLDSQRQKLAELSEEVAFERTFRDRDREELAKVRQMLADERERRIVLEGTLRQTEARAATEVQALEARHTEARRRLESELANAAERLLQVADETQALHTRMETELQSLNSERDRLLDSELFGYAVLREDAGIVRCNTTFAKMFGFDSVEDALAGSPQTVRARVADHAHVLDELRNGRAVAHAESVLMRANGRPFRALTSAALVPLESHGDFVAVERLVIDQDDRTRLEEQLRLTRRLEAAGRLGAEMADVIESALPAFVDPAMPAAEPTLARIRQLLAFCRRQGRSAGLLSLSDTIGRVEEHLRRTAGDAVTFSLHIDDVPPVAAGEDDVEQLVVAMVHAGIGSLPFGGDVLLDARSVRTGFDLRTELSVRATGYGVQTISISSFLARLVSRCGGTVRVWDDPGRSTRLLVHLPC